MEKDKEEGFALFIDNSGSVGGSLNYWNTVSMIFGQYAKDTAHYYLWNSTCDPTTKKVLENNITSRKGTGGTSPNNVATEIVQKRFKRIILVTDGQVGNEKVQLCDKIFETAADKGFKLSKSICYIVSSEYGSLNMSVTCPFTRYCENQVFTKEKDKPLASIVQYTAQDYQILDQLEEITLENFEAKFDLIQGLIIALNMGKSGNIPLKNQLVSMKNRLVKELSKKMSKGTDYAMEIRGSLEEKNLEAALEVASIMSLKYFSEDMTTDLEKKISGLINLCGDLTGMYSIGQIKSNKMATAQSAKEGKLDVEVEMKDLSKNPIECPIILDEDVPQILIDECEPFLLGVDKKIVDDIAACPLRILNYKDIKEKFKKCLSTFTGVKYADKMMKNPFTQNRLLGAIPLGTHKSHVEVGDYTLAKMISGGQILGNLNMYYAVIWHLIAEGEIEYLKDIKENATEHLVYRLRNSRTMASLSGLAHFVTTNVTSDVAVWYCVNSGYLNQPTDRDTFRFHVFNMDLLIRMTEALGYPIHPGIKPHLNRTKALLQQLTLVKKANTDQKKQMSHWFSGLYQKGIILPKDTKFSKEFREREVCSRYIPIDGEASQEQIDTIRMHLPKSFAELSNEEIYFVSTLADASKSASDIFLDFNLKAPALPKAKVNWCYGLNDQDDSQVQFNPKTLRPFYHVKGELWEECAKRCFKVNSVTKLFKGCKYLEAFIAKHERLPVYHELLIFYFNRYVEADKTTTLPYLSEQWTHELVEKFNKAAEGRTVPEIIQLLNLSRPVIKREQMEA